MRLLDKLPHGSDSSYGFPPAETLKVAGSEVGRITLYSAPAATPPVVGIWEDLLIRFVDSDVGLLEYMIIRCKVDDWWKTNKEIMRVWLS